MDLFSPATERNKTPIGDILLPALKKHQWDRVLEVGSRNAQHAQYFLEQSPILRWQTTDIPEAFEDLVHCVEELKLNAPPPRPFDVSNKQHWNDLSNLNFDVIYTANTFHIMSWESVKDFWSNLKLLSESPKGIFVYGPFFDKNVETAPSNLEFDQSLKNRIPGAGIRQLEDILELSTGAGFHLDTAHFMPANNRLLVFTK